MRRVNLLRQAGSRLLSAMVAVLSFAPVVAFAALPGRVQVATSHGDGPIPDLLVAQMVRLSLEAEFAQAGDGGLIYLVGENMRPNWLPTELPARIILITTSDSFEKQRAGERYYYFTEPARRDFGYSIGLVHPDGDRMQGPVFHFAELDGKLRLIPTDEVVTVVG